MDNFLNSNPEFQFDVTQLTKAMQNARSSQSLWPSM